MKSQHSHSHHYLSHGQHFFSFDLQNFFLIVPSSASLGSVEPINFLKSSTALSFSSTAATIGPLVIKFIKSLKKVFQNELNRTLAPLPYSFFCILMLLYLNPDSLILLRIGNIYPSSIESGFNIVKVLFVFMGTNLII